MEQRTQSAGLITPVIIIVIALLLIAISPLIVAHVSAWLGR